MSIKMLISIAMAKGDHSTQTITSDGDKPFDRSVTQR